MLKKILSKTMAGLCLLTTLQCKAAPVESTAPAATKILARQQASPLIFTENRGQVTDMAGNIRPDILFTAHSGNTNLFLKTTGLYYQFTRIIYPKGYDPTNTDVTKTDPAKLAALEKQIETQTYNFSLTLEGANPHPNVIRKDKSVTEQNFYLPQCPDGLKHVASYQKLVYEEVYPHIDWVLYSDGTHLKYDFIVKAGGDPAMIKLKIKDAQNTSITKEGELLIKTSLGEVKEKTPLSFTDGRLIKSSFKQNSDGTIGFEVAAQDHELRIDPAVVWSTYYGGTGSETGYGCVVDGNGNVYMAGATASSTGIASGGFQTTFGGSPNDAFLAKFDASGYLVWATYYGGTGDDQGLGCTRDGNNNIYLIGKTTSTANIASNGFQNTNGGGIDAFLVKFDASGNRLWGTFYGGAGTENPIGNQSVFADRIGNIYLAGNTATSTTGIAGNGFQNTSGGGSDAFLAKFDASGNRLWGTYYGGTGTETGNACTADNNGNVYLTGQTQSTSGIAFNGFQNAFSINSDAYLVKFAASGNRIWGTYYAGTGAADAGNVCIADTLGNVYMAGVTTSTTNIANGGFQNALGGSQDGFLVKFNASGGRLWGTYYGGSSSDQFRSCVLDASGNIYLSGVTGSNASIASSGFQNTFGGSTDAFVVEFNAAGSRLWSSYFGGTASEVGYSCALDTLGNLYMSGLTNSTTGVALRGTYQSTFGGATDAFLVKIGSPGLFTDTAITGPFCTGSSMNVPFTLFGTYNSGNVFTAQLSNASGSFASPVNIGTIAGIAAGTINATIPGATPAGTGYRIRIISSNPVMTAPNNGTNLTITHCCVPTTSTVTEAICSNLLPYTWHGDVVTAGGIAVADDTLVNAGGCDSIITLNLTIKQPTTGTESKAYCTNQLPQTWHGTTIPVGAVTNAAYATFTTTNAAGCDSVVTLNLTIKQATTGIESKAYCANQLPQTWHGTTIPVGAVTNAAYATFTTTNAAGCDSVVTLNLTIKQTTTGAESKTYCSNQLPQAWHGTTIPVGAVTNAAYATFTTTNAAGCDSIVTLNLTIKQTTTGTESKTYCASQLPQIWHGTTIPMGAVTNAAYATFTTTNAVGCDSVVTLNLTIKQATTGIESKAYCANQLPQTWHGTTIPIGAVTNAAYATFTTTNAAGCDSIVTLNLTIKQTTTGTESKTYCASQLPQTWNGTTIPVGAVSNAAYATFTTTNAAGCDSIVTLNLTVTPAVTPDITINANPGNVICTGTSVTFTAATTNGGSTPVYQWRKNGTTVSTSSSYTSNTLNNNDTIICILGSSLACVTNVLDTSNAIIMSVSTAAAPVVIITATPGTTISAGTLVTFTATVTNGGSAPLYQWKKNNVIVSTNTTYASNTLTNNDTITCTVTGSGCGGSNTVTSNPLIIKISTGISSVAGSDNNIILYPNPNNGTFTVQGDVVKDKTAVIEVINAVGQMIYQKTIAVENGKLSTQISLPADVYANGIYLLRVRSASDVDVLRFTISR